MTYNDVVGLQFERFERFGSKAFGAEPLAVRESTDGTLTSVIQIWGARLSSCVQGRKKEQAGTYLPVSFPYFSMLPAGLLNRYSRNVRQALSLRSFGG
jgi:hypothetical protein